MNENITVKIGADISNLSKSLGKAQSDLNGFGSKLGSVMKTIGAAAVAGTAIAGGAMLKFGTDAVKSAADMQATQAQFDQVFGSLGGEATKTLQTLGKEFGMLPERLKGPLSMTTSMFKGLGLDTQAAMEAAAASTKVAADAAAFYDLSYESANAALSSFIKGNYEGGEAIGLFANESQIAAFAAKELGLDWKNATEAQKQLTRQDFAIAMQEAAGATGQASRESENLTNVQGNLTSAWQTLLGKLGTPILPMVTDWVIALTNKVQSFNADKLIADFTSFYNKGKEAVTMIKDFVDKFSPLIAGVLAGAVAYKAITAGIVAYNAVLKAYRAVALLATTGQIGLNLAMLANPITIVVLAIGALIAIGVALYKNQDQIIAKTTKLWSTIKQKFNDIKTAVTASMTAVKTVITNKWNEVMSFFRAIDLRQIGIEIIAGLIGGITSKATELYNKARDIANSVKNTFKNLFDINSPSRFMEKFIGVNMMDGWIKGIVGMKSDVLRATTNMSEWMTPQTPTLAVAGYNKPSMPRASYSTVEHINSSGSNDSIALAKIAHLLEQQIRNGTVIEMDGKKVGDLVTRQISRNMAVAYRSGGGGGF